MKVDNAAVAAEARASIQRPDESRQVLLQLHFEFSWIVGSQFLCATHLSWL